nr:RNA-directed DNA polymerase, eukaryota, reverse transcriptase zinc-binding domain protein [Tanacetum cinerariifolium]
MNFIITFEIGFIKPPDQRATVDMSFPNFLSPEQQADLECDVTAEELKQAVWDCGLEKSPGPDGFSFRFYRQFWETIEKDVFKAINHFFTHTDIPKGCNSSFIAVIPKIPDANLVKDFRPISLIGSIYKIIAKILTNRLVKVIGDIVVDAGMFTGINPNQSVNLSHLFYADDAVFVGQWNDRNINTITQVLKCFFHASGLRINMSKSRIMGIHVNRDIVQHAAGKMGCLILNSPFSYL